MSKLFVDEIVHQSSQGSGTITLGASGETVQLAAGATQSGFGGTNTPAFLAYLSSNQDIANDANTVVQVNTEVFDTDSCYDTGTYRFTPTTAGKYLIYASINTNSKTLANNIQYVANDITKNGSQIEKQTISTYNQNYLTEAITKHIIVVDMNGTTDYVQIRGAAGGTGDMEIRGGAVQTFFGAYKIIE